MRMLWYKHLYVGEKARKHRFSIIQNIRRNKLQADIYVITPASNGNNLLDIYPTVCFLHPHYKEQEMLVVGIAEGYNEALEVAALIVNEMYQKTGAFQLESFLKEKESIKV